MSITEVTVEVKAVQNGFVFTRSNGNQFAVPNDEYPGTGLQRAVNQFAETVQLAATLKGLKPNQKLKITFITEEVIG